MTEPAASAPQPTDLTSLVPEADWVELANVAGGVGRFVMDLETRQAQIDPTLRRLTGMLELVGTFDADAFMARVDPADAPAMEAAIARTAATGEPYDVAFRFLRPTGRPVWLAGHGRRMTSSDGRELLVGVNYDVTDLRVERERAELLAGEMAHRMKNVFALIQGIFNTAARGAPDVPALAEAFTGRLQALAAVNALTFADPDRAVPLGALARAVLGGLIDDGRVRADLAEFALNGAAAQTVVLMINELMTNAVKYGALSRDGGVVDLSVAILDGGFAFRWAEAGGPPLAGPPEGRGGFGTKVLRGMSAATFSGTPEFDWRPEGLVFTCTWPAAEFAPRTAVAASATSFG